MENGIQEVRSPLSGAFFLASDPESRILFRQSHFRFFRMGPRTSFHLPCMSEFQTRKPESGDKLVRLETTHGTVLLRFFPSEAPKAVENFLTLTERGYYDGIVFHRVIKNFMVQCGDPT